MSLAGLSSSISQAQVYYHGKDGILREGRGKQCCLKPSFRTYTLSFLPHSVGHSKSQDKLSFNGVIEPTSSWKEPQSYLARGLWRIGAF